MSGFVDYPVQVDPDLIVQQTLAELRTATGAQLNEGHPLVALVETIAYRHAETRIILSDVAAAAFRDFGLKVIGVARIDAAAATVSSTWTASDDAGYTIPAGAIVTYPTAGDRQVAFQVVDETVIAPGDTVAAGVELAAVVPGAAANGLAAGTLTVSSPLPWVASVVSDAETAGGLDAETDAEYLDRLAQTLRLLSRVPIRPGDYAVAARSIPGVHRALVVNLYDADTDTPDSEGHVTVIPVTEAGDALDGSTKTEVQELLSDDGVRLLNVIVHVEDPTPVAFDVDFTAVAEDDADPAEVEAAAIAIITEFLDPGTWAGGGDDPPEWRDEPIVRWLDLVGLLYDVDGLDTVTALTIDTVAGNLDMSDDGIGGPGTILAPLPNATVTGTVS